MMQATGRMAGGAGLSVSQALAALLVATTLVVGIVLVAQRITLGGAGAVAAPADDAAGAEQYLIDHRKSEKDLNAGAFAGTWTSGDVGGSLAEPKGPPYSHIIGQSSVTNPAAWRVIVVDGIVVTPEQYLIEHRRTEKAPLVAPSGPDAVRRGGIQIR